MAGCSPVPSEEGSGFGEKKTVFSKLASDFVPLLAPVKSPLKSPSVKALLNVLAQNWSRKKPGESQSLCVWRKLWAAGCPVDLECL